MDDGRHDLAVSGAVASQFVGDQLPGRTALPLQQLAEESFGGFLITARLDGDVPPDVEFGVAAAPWPA